MSYESALFCQLFAEELASPYPLRRKIRTAMQRLSPTLKAREIAPYTDSLYATMVVEEQLRPDWRERVATEH